MTTRPYRHSPFLSREGNFCMLLFIQLLHSCLLRRGKSATNYRDSQALTYKDEPSAHGRCELEARRSVHPERMQVGALTSIWQVGVPPAEAQGVDSANSLFYKKVRSNISHGFTYSILISTTSRQRPGFQQYGNQRFHDFMDLQPMTTRTCRHSPSLSREGNM